MTDPVISLLHSLIIGLVIYIVFRLIFRSPEEFSQMSSIIIACFSCIYLISYDMLKKLI
jgi:hypothetical protein